LRIATARIIAIIASAKAPIVTRTISFENVRFPSNVILLAKKYGKFKLKLNL
jgi:hypothetical protein